MLTTDLDFKVGFHEHIEIRYYNGQFEAAFYVEDGQRKIEQAFGKTIFDAILALNTKIQSIVT